jgi:hypothetical protein
MDGIGTLEHRGQTPHPLQKTLQEEPIPPAASTKTPAETPPQHERASASQKTARIFSYSRLRQQNRL